MKHCFFYILPLQLYSVHLLKILEDKKGTVSVSVVNPHNVELFKTKEYELKENINIDFEIENAELWSAENPNLYTLYFILKDEKGEVKEVVPLKTGIRKFELKDGLMKLNGKRIIFKVWTVMSLTVKGEEQ